MNEPVSGKGIVGDQRGRIVLFAAIAVAAFLAAIPASVWLSRSPADLTQAQRLGGEIGCTCGTCPHRPIATCGCGFADGMLARLDSEIAAGHTDAEIMTTFVAEYGNGIRIKPEGSGFGLMAWAAPIAFLMVGAVAMAGVIAQWRSQADEGAVTDQARASGMAPLRVEAAGSHANSASDVGAGGEAAADNVDEGAEAAKGPDSDVDAIDPSAEGDADRYRAIVERELDALDD